MSYVEKSVVKIEQDLMSKFLHVIEEFFDINAKSDNLEGVVLLNDDELSRQCKINEITSHMNYHIINDYDKEVFILDVKNLTKLCIFRKLLYTGIVNKNIKFIIIKNMHNNLKDNIFKTQKLVKIISNIKKYTKAPILISGNSSIKDEFMKINYFKRKFNFIYM